MNYTLTLNLEGADKTDAALSGLLEKISKLSGSKMPFDKWMEFPKDIDSQGNVIGEKFGKSFAKSFKQYGMSDLAKIFSKQGFATPQTPDWMSGNFFNSGKTIKGLREVGGKDLAKVLALPDINDLEPKLNKIKILTAGIATLFNPFVGARLLSDVVPKGHMSGGGGMAGAIFGAAGAAGYGEIFVVVKLLQAAFKMLVSAIRQTVQAYDDARKLYAKALTSGLGLGFTVKRSMLADILGVSETEVIRFGSAWQYLNQRLSFASDQLAKTATPLAGVGWEFKIVGQNIKALWSEIAIGLAPAIKALISEFNDFLSTLGQTQVLEAVGTIISKTIQQAVNLIGLIEIIVNAQYVGYRMIFDSVKLMVAEVVNLIAKIPFAAKLGVKSMDINAITGDMQKVTKSWTDEVTNWAKNLNGAKVNDVPSPQAWMKQLGASTWEKMGLVVAGGSGNTTNDLIRKSNDYLATIAGAVKVGTGVPRGYQFGLSPQVNNP